MIKIKVLQLHPDYNIRKMDISDLGEQLFKALPAERFETVTAFLSGKPGQGQPESIAHRSVYFGFSAAELKGLRIKALWRLYKFLKQERFDVVICNRYKPVNMMLTLARFLKIPKCIAIVHGFGDYDRRYRKKQLARNLTDNWVFVGVSAAVREYLIALKAGLTDKNTSYITNAIDLAAARDLMLDKANARAALGLSSDAVLIGAMGRLVPLKAHDCLINAFSALAHEFPDTQLAILGEGRERERLEQLIAQLGLEERVQLIGFKEDALQYLKAFDVWTMPSLREGLGLALLEGMCAGLPVIASSVPAMLPLVQGAEGIAVTPGSVEELTAALRKYLEMTDEERQQAGSKVLDYVINNHGIDEFRNKYLQLISSGF